MTVQGVGNSPSTDGRAERRTTFRGADPATVVWLDLRDPDRDDIDVLRAGFGLHEVAVEDAVDMHERRCTPTTRTSTTTSCGPPSGPRACAIS